MRWIGTCFGMWFRYVFFVCGILIFRIDSLVDEIDLLGNGELFFFLKNSRKCN